IALAPLACMAGLVLGHSDVASAQHECGTFQATRPLTDAALSSAVLRVAGLSVLATWGLWMLAMVTSTAVLYVAQGSAPVLDLWTDHGRFQTEFGAMGVWYAAWMMGGCLVIAWIPLAWGTVLVLTGRQRWIMGCIIGGLVTLLL